MSFTLGFPTDDKEAVAPALKAKNIMQMRAAPYNVRAYGIIQLPQVMYKMYTSFLSHYMRATVMGTRIPLDTPFVPLALDLKFAFPIQIPIVGVTFARPLSSETLEWMKSVGYEQVMYRNKALYLFDKISRENLRKLITIGPNQTCAVPDRAINIGAFGSMTLVHRLFSNFLITQRYPAYNNVDHPGESPEVVEEIRGSKRARESSSGDASQGQPGMRPVEGSEDETMEPVPSSSADTTSTPVTSKNRKRFAQPTTSPRPAWGTIDDIPNTDGLFCPFFLELANQDGETIPALLERYFMPSLGSSANMVKETLESVRSACGVFKGCDTGLRLTHLAKCIELAIQSQAQCFPVFDGGIYSGSAILGAKFEIVVSGVSHIPVPHSTLINRIKDFGSHTVALKAIFTIAGIDVANMEDDISIGSMMELRTWLASKSLTASQRDEVQKLSTQLRFPPTWVVTSDNIEKALSLLRDDQSLPEDLPIHPSALFTTDRIYLVWSCFGRLAPTCAFPSSPSHDLTKKDRPGKFVWEQRDLVQAVQDLKAIRSSKKVTVPNQKRRSGSYQTYEYKGSQASGIFAEMTKFCLGIDVAPTNHEIEASTVGETSTQLGLFDI